jgi:hypothetical protein
MAVPDGYIEQKRRVSLDSDNRHHEPPLQYAQYDSYGLPIPYLSYNTHSLPEAVPRWPLHPTYMQPYNPPSSSLPAPMQTSGSVPHYEAWVASGGWQLQVSGQRSEAKQAQPGRDASGAEPPMTFKINMPKLVTIRIFFCRACLRLKRGAAPNSLLTTAMTLTKNKREIKN